jgi:phosphoglucomutase
MSGRWTAGGLSVQGLIAKVKEGFASVDIGESLKEAALENLGMWLTDDRFRLYRPAVEALIEEGRWALLVDSFYRMLPFGTGGRRGSVGVGPNRMNPFAVTTSVQGHCSFLARRYPGDELRVVLAADVRCFRDARNLYRRGSLGPLEGLTSKALSMMAASVYAANGVKVVMADPAEETYVSTPELSFLIFNLGAHGGLNMSASHNPPDDNGAKFYNAAGGQEVPPFDEELVKVASQVSSAKTMAFDDAVAGGMVQFLTREQRQAYRDLNVGLSLDTTARGAKVAFSSLHGTGITTAAPVLEQAGFDVVIEPTQNSYDGAFPNVPHQIPNPEVPSAMEAVIAVAQRTGCHVAMATDPDADRLGVAIPGTDGDWHCLTGNQIGVLLADHILSLRKDSGLLLPSNYLVKTEVTTALIERLAKEYGVRCIGNLLVGFKYIGDVLDQVERTGRYGESFAARTTDFLLAVEESHGVLATEQIRDKDAANGALLIAEAASRALREGSSLAQRLLNIYKRYGYYGTGLKSVVMEGADGLARIGAIQESLRQNPPTRIAGRKVISFHDRQDEGGVFGPIKSGTDLESRNVLVFELEGGVRLVLRPSGTEPKNKTYAEVAAPPLGVEATNAAVNAQVDAVNERITALLAQWEVEMLARVGIDFPAYASAFADSLPLSRKLAFVQGVAPELRQIADVGTDVNIAVERVRKLLKPIGPVDMLLRGIEQLALGWPARQQEYWARILARLI